jgi:hypothetical protein
MAAAVGFSILVLGGCGGTASPSATVTEAAAAPVTVTATPTDEPIEEPVEETPSATVAPETFTMPKLAGKNLQLAQDMLQHEGSYLLDQKDALGLDRLQINDSNWKVCKQSPKAGKKVAVDTMVTLSSVKLTEDCP